MVAVQLSLPWTVCIACSLFIPVLALPSFHKRTFSPTTPEKRSTVPLTNIITSPTVLIAENGTSSTNFLPACWPDFPSPAPKAPPITNPRDCGEAIRHMINEGRATEPVVWFAQRDWTYNSCAIFLIPAGGIRTPRDTFSRLEIAREASAIQMACATGAHGYRGGVVPIGVGIFEVALVGRPTTLGLEESWQVELANETALEKRALPLQGLPQLSAPSSLPAKANSPASTSKHPVTSLGWSPDCWSYYPPPGGHDPITTPSDCGSVILQIIQESQATRHIIWSTSRTWIYGSCMIRLVPDYADSRDTFSRLDIARAASRVQIACVNEAHGFRGGSLELGPKGTFDVSVEAPDHLKLE